MAFDVVTGTVVMFGGYKPDFSGLQNETAEWDGTTWTHDNPTGALPVARDEAAMAYDEDSQTLVLFGGANAANAHLADTWEWNGSTWIQDLPATSPPVRQASMMAYDSASHRLAMFAGFGDDGSDMWEWDGTTWTQEQTTLSPGLHVNEGFVYDIAHDDFVVFGGLDQATGGLYSDTWTFTEVAP